MPAPESNFFALRGWGPDAPAPLPPIDLGWGRKVVEISLGSDYACVILDTGQLKCWGIASGLGLGSRNSRGDDPGEMGENLPEVDLGGG